MFTEYKLKNGARVILIPDESASSTVLIEYPVGSRYEPEKLSGVSHYIEHLMFKGTKKRKNTFVLTREIDRLGAEYNAFTGKDYTGYYIKADSTFLTTSLDILSDMLLNSVFDPKEMEREKGPIIEELKMYRDNPMMNIDSIFEDCLYKGSLGRDIGGTDKHVQSYKRPDVLAYKKKYYDVSNMTIVISGGLPENVKDLVEKYFGAEKNKVKPSRSFQKFAFEPTAKSKRIAIQHKAADQVQLMLGFPSFDINHKDNAALGVLNTILGGTMSSRLFITVRERHGLAYMVRAGAESFADTGYSYIRAGLDPKNINKAITLIKKEIEKISTKPVTARELKDAKMHIRGAMTLSLEDSSVVANYFAKQALFKKKIATPEERLALIEKVTAADIMRVAKKVFKMNQMRVACIGDVKASDITF